MPGEASWARLLALCHREEPEGRRGDLGLKTLTRAAREIASRSLSMNPTGIVTFKHVILSNAKDLLFNGRKSRSFALLRMT